MLSTGKKRPFVVWPMAFDLRKVGGLMRISTILVICVLWPETEKQKRRKRCSKWPMSKFRLVYHMKEVMTYGKTNAYAPVHSA